MRVKVALLLAVVSIGSLQGDEKDIRTIPYSTRFGGREYDLIYDLVTDADGNAYVTGSTTSADLPLRKPLQSAVGGAGGTSSTFVAKIDVSGELLFSTYWRQRERRRPGDRARRRPEYLRRRHHCLNEPANDSWSPPAEPRVS